MVEAMVHLVEIAEPSRRDRGKVRQYAHIHPIYDLRSACLCVCVCAIKSSLGGNRKCN